LIAGAKRVTIGDMRAILVLLALTAAAHAQPSDPTAGAKLFEEGRELAKQNRFAEACDKFEKSYALDNGVGTELNLADCQEHLGHFAMAYRMFDEAASRLAGDNRQKFAHDRAEALVPKLATTVVKLADAAAPGVSVTIAGRAVKASAEITERVDPGTITVRVVIPGKPTFEKSQSAAAGATVIFDAGGGGATTTTTTDIKPNPTTPTVTTTDTPTTVRRHGRVVAAYITGGAGLATLGVGIGLGFAANSKYNTAVAAHCTKNGTQIICDSTGYADTHDAGTLADTGTVIGAVGLAAVAAGAILFFTAPRDIVVTPTASDRAAGLSISGRF
jgi:hypothetical protein